MMCPDCGHRLRVANVSPDRDEDGVPFVIRSRKCDNPACNRRLSTLEFPVEFSTPKATIATGGE